MLALLAVCKILRCDNTADGQPSEAKGKRAVRLAGALVLITVISVGMLWSFYGFRYEPHANHLAMNPAYAQFVNVVGGLRDQVQPEFADFVATGNLGDGGEEIDGVVEGDPVSDHSAGILSFCRHSGGDEHRLATHFADVRFSDRSNRGSGLDVDPGEPALGVSDCRAADFSGGIHDADVSCVHGVCQ